MWLPTEDNRVCGGQRKLIEYMVVNESLIENVVANMWWSTNRVYVGGQRKLIEYVVVNES